MEEHVQVLKGNKKTYELNECEVRESRFPAASFSRSFLPFSLPFSFNQSLVSCDKEQVHFSAFCFIGDDFVRSLVFEGLQFGFNLFVALQHKDQIVVQLFLVP